MLGAAECIVDGTWASGAPPREWTDFCVMREMHWSWEQYRATPPYVVRFCGDFIAILNKKAKS